jgi:hypothetical protein
MTVCARRAAQRDHLIAVCYHLLTPLLQALCHCADCRKISGGNYSNNIVVPSENFKVLSGTPKQISKIADSGKEITSKFIREAPQVSRLIARPFSGHFCSDCGTTLFRHGDSFGGINGMRIIKAGILDDVNIINNTKPGAELFAPKRINWVTPLDGAQLDAMPPA